MNIEDYFKIAQNETFSSNCLRRHIGAVIVNDGVIIGKGTNQVPKSMEPCSEKGWCIRNRLNMSRGEGYDVCNSIHAEINAIKSAPFNLLKSSVMYMVGYDAVSGESVENLACCEECKKEIAKAGIKIVYIRQSNNCYIKVVVDKWSKSIEYISK